MNYPGSYVYFIFSNQFADFHFVISSNIKSFLSLPFFNHLFSSSSDFYSVYNFYFTHDFFFLCWGDDLSHISVDWQTSLISTCFNALLRVFFIFQKTFITDLVFLHWFTIKVLLSSMLIPQVHFYFFLVVQILLDFIRLWVELALTFLCGLWVWYMLVFYKAVYVIISVEFLLEFFG